MIYANNTGVINYQLIEFCLGDVMIAMKDMGIFFIGSTVPVTIAAGDYFVIKSLEMDKMCIAIHMSGRTARMSTWQSKEYFNYLP